MGVSMGGEPPRRTIFNGEAYFLDRVDVASRFWDQQWAVACTVLPIQMTQYQFRSNWYTPMIELMGVESRGRPRGSSFHNMVPQFGMAISWQT